MFATSLLVLALIATVSAFAPAGTAMILTHSMLLKHIPIIMLLQEKSHLVL